MKKMLKLYMEKPELAALLLLVLLILLFQVRSGGVFLSLDNLRGFFGILPEMALVAIGVTVLMICGEFDLSVGAVFALMPMTMAVLMTGGLSFPLALLAGLLVCVVIGLLNGYLTLRFAIPSFITTLGMMFVARSLTVVISGGFPPLLPADLPTWMFTSFVGPGALIRASFLWFLAISIVVSLLLSRTNIGNWIRATGGFLPAAEALGIPTARVKIACFILCSVLSGGVGTVFGGIIGVILIRVIDNGLILSQVDANWFKFAIGSLTIFAVVANSWLRKRAKSIKLEV